MSGGTHHHGPLAGLTAAGAAALFAFGVLALCWHRVAGQVSAAVAFLAYTVIAAVAFMSVAGAYYVFLWVRHRARNPELLSRQPVRTEALPASPAPLPPAIGAARPAAIEPPRVYLNVTDDQLAAIMQHYTEGDR